MDWCIWKIIFFRSKYFRFLFFCNLWSLYIYINSGALDEVWIMTTDIDQNNKTIFILCGYSDTEYESSGGRRKGMIIGYQRKISLCKRICNNWKCFFFSKILLLSLYGSKTNTVKFIYEQNKHENVIRKKKNCKVVILRSCSEKWYNCRPKCGTRCVWIYVFPDRKITSDTWRTNNFSPKRKSKWNHATSSWCVIKVFPPLKKIIIQLLLLIHYYMMT